MPDFVRVSPDAIWGALPRHNDDLFRPAAWADKVLSVAARFDMASIDAAILEAEASIARNHGIEFDDVRSRHKTGKSVSALKAARSLKHTALKLVRS